MRAMVVTSFGGVETLEELDIDAPEPGPGDVSIDVDYAAVGLLDVLVRRGELPELVKPPFVPGLEVAGRIRAVGEGVSGLSVGDSVVSLSRPTGGGYAEVAVAAAALSIPFDAQKIDPATAVATVPNLVTAVGALSLAGRIRDGESVLVLGAGGGLASTFPAAARSLGAARVVGIVSSESKAAAVRGFGFDDVIIAARLEDLDERFDIIVDPVGGELRTKSMNLLAPLGRLLAVGNASGDADTSVGANELWLSNAGVIGFNVGGLLAAQPDIARQLADRALDLLQKDAVHIPVETIPLAEAAEAHRRLESRTIAGKIVLRVS